MNANYLGGLRGRSYGTREEGFLFMRKNLTCVVRGLMFGDLWAITGIEV